MKKINEVSQIVGVSKRTLQYYDDEEILKIERTTNNHRVYDESTLERIWKILVYKEMGFGLKAIKQLLKLPNSQKEIYFIKQIEAIENQIITLKVQMRIISLVQAGGMPIKPEEHSGKTYVRCIKEIRGELQKKIMEGENCYENE